MGRYEFNQRDAAIDSSVPSRFSRAVERDRPMRRRTPRSPTATISSATRDSASGRRATSGHAPLRKCSRHFRWIRTSAEAHAALGYVRHYEWQWADAEREFRRAIELNPSYPLAHLWYANLLVTRKRREEAIREAYAARDLDPFSLSSTQPLEVCSTWPAAMPTRSHNSSTRSSWTRRTRWRVCGWRTRSCGRSPSRGDRGGESFGALTDRSGPSVAVLAWALLTAGRPGEARALVRELIARSSREYIGPISMGQLSAALGDVDVALFWMTKTVEEHSDAIVYVDVNPEAAPAMRDPRFRAVLARAGFR